MDLQKLYFRTRGGPLHGWGNIFRLEAFASFCRENAPSDIRFFVEGPGEIIKYLERKGFKITLLPEDISLEEESRIFAEYPKADVIFMEMLDSNYSRQAVLKKYTRQLVVFDDLLDHRYCADIVLCGQDLPGYGNIDISDRNTKFLTGTKYFLCRPEFKPYLTKRREYSESIRNILIVLGGGRYDIGYLKAAKALALSESGIKTEFVLGYASNEELVQEIRKILPQAEIRRGVTNVEELLWETDFAIASGGYCKFEAAMTKTPFAIMATQWHQIPLASEFSKKTGTPFLGYMSFVPPADIMKCIKTFNSADRRKEMAHKASKIIDGNGFYRAYSEIFGRKNTCTKINVSLQ